MVDRHDEDSERSALDLLLRGFQVSRLLRIVADLGIADRIAPDAQVTIAVLAGQCGVQAQPLIRVLRALASFGVFTLTVDGDVGHTPRSRLLRTDTPNSMHHSARFWTAPGSWSAWGMLDVALTGGVPHEAAWKMGRFDYLRAHPDEAREFDAMMASFPGNGHAAIAAAYDFSGAKLIADVGGGNGAALRHVLMHYPAAHGLLFDRDDVIAAVKPDGLLDGRIEKTSGSFFDEVPRGADVTMLIRVLHDWSDEDCLRILQVCRAAAGPKTALLVCEQILEPDPVRGRPTSYLVDAQMMAMFGSARERTLDEFTSLLSASGFTTRQAIPTQSAVWIVEAVPA